MNLACRTRDCRPRECAPCTRRGLAHRASDCVRSLCCPRSVRRPSTARARPRDRARGRRIRVAHRRVECGRDVLHGIEDREVVGAEFRRAVELAVAVHGRIATIRAGQVVHVRLRIGPVANGGDDVALCASRPLRRAAGSSPCAMRSRPVGEILDRHACECAHGRARSFARPPALIECDAPTPRART